MDKNVAADFLNQPWVYYGVGILFCITGIYLFSKNVYEEDRSIKGAVLLLIAGVVLIAVGAGRIRY